MKRVAWLLLIAPLLGAMSIVASSDAGFTAAELAVIKSLGPWPPQAKADPSNRLSQQADAIAFGKRLFMDPRLSKSGAMSCATCHQAVAHFADGAPRPAGLDRNTIALANLGQHRWFGWDGRSDTLWGQSIHPMVAANEMGLSADELKQRVIDNVDLINTYSQIFATDAASSDADVIQVNIAKALAAFQETIVTPRTAFDRYRDAVVAQDAEAIKLYPPSAKRGLKIFAGSGNCASCHFGSAFSNGEFANIGRSHFTGDRRVDPGRFGGLEKLKASHFNRAGRFSDESSDSAARAPASFVTNTHATWGQFRVPSLRNVANTAPYMHDGSIQTLEDVVDYYNNPDMERIHTAGVQLVRPLGLSEQDRKDLVNFLQTLSATADAK